MPQPLLASPAAKNTLELILEETRAAGYPARRLRPHARARPPPHRRAEAGNLRHLPPTLQTAAFTALRFPGTEQFWQRRCYDRNVRTHNEPINIINHIHRNPRKRGLVAEPKHNRWSSACHDETGEPSSISLHHIWPSPPGTPPPVPGTLHVNPMHGYGAIEIGRHRFFHTGSTTPAGEADFIHLWHFIPGPDPANPDAGGQWKLARVLSYDHNSAAM